MRITTRIAAGLFLMAALLIGALTYQLSIADRLQEVNRELADTNLEAARISIQVLQGIEGVREFAAKASALRDAEYRLQWTEWEASVEAALGRLASLGLAGEEVAIRRRIEEGWRAYRGAAPGLWLDATRLGAVDAMLADIRTDVERLIEVNEASVAARAAASSAAGERARLGAWLSAAAALLIAGIGSLLLFESISGPLRRLTRGTRELAEGRFEHRLAVDGPADLAGLARDFNHMAQRLDELEELKKDFVSHVSHELKTPLAAVHETVEVLLEELPGPITDRQRHLLELARSSSQRLSSMIGNLLETSRLEAGAATYDPAPHELPEILDSVLEELRPVAAERGIEFERVVDGSPAAPVCDGDRMREVVANLVGNAVKFSPEGRPVRVEVSERSELPPGVPPRRAGALMRERAPFLFVTVSDEGIGVPDEHKPRIFEKFHQVRGKQRIRGQGVGLGLAISRRIVEAHGGAVWVEDRPGGGAVFRVLLPAVPARWRSEFEAEVEGPRPAPTRTSRGAPARAGASALLLLVLPVAGCGTLVGSGERPSPVETTEPVEAAERPLAPDEPEPERTAADRLADARGLLEAGAFSEAAGAFDGILAEGAVGDVRAEALWGRALVHLAPSSPLRDPAAAIALLRRIETEAAPESVYRIQASWARESLERVAALTQQVSEQEAAIRQLNEALEMLRRIDLERRPGGAARPEPPPDGGG